MSSSSQVSSVVYTGSRQSAIAEVCRKLREVRQLCSSPTNVPAADRIARIEGLAVAAQSLAEVALLAEKAGSREPDAKPAAQGRSRSQPGHAASSAALVERALDKALRRLVFLETQSRENVSAAGELDRRLREERSRAKAEREEALAVARRLEEANRANADSARRWRARAESLEARCAEASQKLREAEQGKDDAMQRLRALYLRYQEAQESLHAAKAECASLRREREEAGARGEEDKRENLRSIEKMRSEFSAREQRSKQRISALEEQVGLLASLMAARGRRPEEQPPREVIIARKSKCSVPQADQSVQQSDAQPERRPARPEPKSEQTDSGLFEAVQYAVAQTAGGSASDVRNGELRESAVVSSLLQPAESWPAPSLRGLDDEILPPPRSGGDSRAAGTAASSRLSEPFPRLSNSQLDRRVNGIAQRILREQGSKLGEFGGFGGFDGSHELGEPDGDRAISASSRQRTGSSPSGSSVGPSSFRDVRSNLQALSRKLRALEGRG